MAVDVAGVASVTVDGDGGVADEKAMMKLVQQRPFS
eukprot:CAMPEP_0117684442 /NCGR_PEP_ID=MMETSP0804-20121206/21094_1 /TAXON_ID=1074897 /ORGANISM="Tetraselmis astigmatica, Strain CCMP880" /LENGTH=35 /DNA_ID= /DNA_START= /DNA_END= /DNA_ORIENTATION=